MNAKIVATLASTILLSSSVMAANCAKNPNHSSCQNAEPTSFLPTVINGDGTVIGQAFNMHREWIPNQIGRFKMGADVRLVYNDGVKDHGYVVRFYSNGLEHSFNGYYGTILSTLSSTCRNAIPTHVRLAEQSITFDDHNFDPFISKDYIVVRAATLQTNLLPSSVGDLMLVKLGSQVSAPSNPIAMMKENYASNENCTSVNSTQGGTVHYTVEDYKWLSSGYSAPITFELR